MPYPIYLIALPKTEAKIWSQIIYQPDIEVHAGLGEHVRRLLVTQQYCTIQYTHNSFSLMV